MKSKPKSPWPVRLAAIRHKMGLSQSQFARKYGIPVRSLINIENGRTPGRAYQLLFTELFSK